MFKINTNDEALVGIVVRNEYDLVMDSSVQKLEALFSLSIAEALVVLCGI